MYILGNCFNCLLYSKCIFKTTLGSNIIFRFSIVLLKISVVIPLKRSSRSWHNWQLPPWERRFRCNNQLHAVKRMLRIRMRLRWELTFTLVLDTFDDIYLASRFLCLCVNCVVIDRLTHRHGARLVRKK